MCVDGGSTVTRGIKISCESFLKSLMSFSFFCVGIAGGGRVGLGEEWGVCSGVWKGERVGEGVGESIIGTNVVVLPGVERTVAG